MVFHKNSQLTHNHAIKSNKSSKSSKSITIIYYLKIGVLQMIMARSNLGYYTLLVNILQIITRAHDVNTTLMPRDIRWKTARPSNTRFKIWSTTNNWLLKKEYPWWTARPYLNKYKTIMEHVQKPTEQYWRSSRGSICVFHLLCCISFC